MNRRPLFAALRSFFDLSIIGQPPTLPVLGNLIDGPGAAAYLNFLLANAAPLNLGLAYSAVTNVTTGALALTPANCAEGIVNATTVCSGGSANTNTTDTATAIINAYWPAAYVGATALWTNVNLNTGTQTVAGGTGVTGSGTLTIPTLAIRWFRLKITNLANPALPGSVSTNSTTANGAVANNAGINNPTSVIVVTSATGIIANASYLQVVQTDGTVATYFVTGVSSTSITVAGNINKNIASGAAVTVFNNAIQLLSMYSIVTAIAAA